MPPSMGYGIWKFKVEAVNVLFFFPPLALQPFVAIAV